MTPEMKEKREWWIWKRDKSADCVFDRPTSFLKEHSIHVIEAKPALEEIEIIVALNNRQHDFLQEQAKEISSLKKKLEIAVDALENIMDMSPDEAEYESGIVAREAIRKIKDEK